ncbi:MAG: winged helix DNA-binding protein [Dehalococcoidales bacterium]|nr:winged helix DNA-binding protein [Dehalococcoidales bacterium]
MGISLDSYLSEANRFLAVLGHASHALVSLHEKELAKYGISSAEAGVLFIIQAIQLSSGRYATPTDISRHSIRRVHSVSELLSRMEKKGLIIRTKNAEKGKRIAVSITEKGQQIYALTARDETVIAQIINVLSKDERTELLNHLQKLTVYAIKHFKSTAPPYLSL